MYTKKEWLPVETSFVENQIRIVDNNLPVEHFENWTELY